MQLVQLPATFGRPPSRTECEGMSNQKPNSVSKPLVEIIKVILTNGTYPEILKIAKIIPIHKTGDKKLWDNYKPISVLHVLNKIC
ncbi:hypothetical protein PR048_010269 [Dryococelus australis]|uniref:Uncharacterized protein n=1 Tax=Dryococelus australis TaxID=614101 RepID=A0ABQ9I280_9NEOP|nr:hypothetical protein PR048_010269 [Dryococelus australis]